MIQILNHACFPSVATKSFIIIKNLQIAAHLIFHDSNLEAVKKIDSLMNFNSKGKSKADKLNYIPAKAR